jgi:hypothetical protein
MTASIAAVVGGWLATCTCGWERFDARRPALDAAIDKHSCPKPKHTHSRAKSAPASGNAWNTRKDSTWIDKL